MYIINTLFVHSIFIDQFLISHKTGGGKSPKKFSFKNNLKIIDYTEKKHKKLHSHNLVGNIETNTDQHYKL